ncbi:MAG: hypothetical protein LBI39_04585 [Puniceicoccales bacterium]|nr:hypothetical protein [Puniceicoccales bacterium]
MNNFECGSQVILANDGAGNICLCEGAMPPEMHLAHEMGHVLYALREGCETNEEQYMGCENFVLDCKSIIDTAIEGVEDGAGKSLFTTIWNTTDPNEVLNILPARNMLGAKMKSANAFHRSDGQFFEEIIGEVGNGVFVRLGHNLAENTLVSFGNLGENKKRNFLKCCENLISQIKADANGRLNPGGAAMTVGNLPRFA